MLDRFDAFRYHEDGTPARTFHATCAGLIPAVRMVEKYRGCCMHYRVICAHGGVDPFEFVFLHFEKLPLDLGHYRTLACDGLHFVCMS